MKLTLETERLILRPFSADDAGEMFSGWASDPEVTKYLTWDTHENVETTRFVLEMWEKEYEDPERINFAIVLKSEQKLIGGIDIVRYEDKKPVIGYNLSRKYWGRGYITEACRCVLDYLFSHGHDEVLIEADVRNAGSNKVIEKCGGLFLKTYSKILPMKNNVSLVNRYVFRKEKS